MTGGGPRTLALLGALLLACGSLACGSEPRDALRPNLVVYLVDTLRRDHLGVYGYERDTSPRLDAFARSAVRFDDAYSSSSWTRPAVASLLTGVSPDRHGAVSRADRLDPSVPLLGSRLQGAGYHTAAFVSNPNVLPVWGFGAGFDDFYDVDAVAASARADDVNEVVLRHLAEKPSEPFFFYVHTRDPHGPYEPPPPFDRAFPRPSPEELGSSDIRTAALASLAEMVSLYDGEIRFNDAAFGDLLDALEKAPLERETVVVFTSDHGEEFREHGGLGHGHSLFQEQVRVPLLVRFPRSAHAGRVALDRVQLLDVVPTLLAAAGLPAAPELPGVDLASRWGGGDPAGRPVFLDLDLTGVTPERNAAEGVVAGPYKLVRHRLPGPSLELFDLSADPDERRNLVLARRPLAAHLDALIAEHRSRVAGGLHLWLVNGGDGAERVIEGRIRSPGGVRAVRPVELEDGDLATLEEDGRVVHFRVTLRDRANPIGQTPRSLVDRDVLVIDVEPAADPVEILELSVDGEPARPFLGRTRERAASMPARLEPLEALRVDSMAALFRATPERSLVAEPGLYVGFVAAPDAAEVEIDADLAERLHALGYMK